MKTPGYVQILADVPLPRVALVRQNFNCASLPDPEAELARLLNSQAGKIKPGMSVAITAGSRGFAGFVELLRVIADFVRNQGGKPFVIPAMGSHGGATAQGQLEVLKKLGVTEESVGCPIRSSMETVEIGKLPNDMSVRVDKNAWEADGIILYNRIKPHSAFRAPLESGLAKMLTIGLGKQHGAESCHMWGFAHMGHLVEEMAEVKLARCKILFGVGVIENALDQIAELAVIAPENLLAEEKRLLKRAMANMPRLPLGPLDLPQASGDLDVLIVDYVGKEFSGAGMDPNITGRPCSPAMFGGPNISRIAVLDVTDKSMGNANGVAAADVITERLFDKFDRESVYMNSITSGLLNAAALPMAMPSDKTAIRAAIKTCASQKPDQIRLMRIPNTLRLNYLYASEALLPELRSRPGIEILSEAQPMNFDSTGNLVDAWPNE